jgi:hypothetical protein
MIEVESKELLCVKCPIDNDWTLIEYCKKECGCGEDMTDESLVCGYDEYVEELYKEFNKECSNEHKS